MERPKGSKNRATLEREAREREVREREEKARETAECKNIDKQSIKLSPGADVESNPSVYLGEGENGSKRTLEGIAEVGGETEDKRGNESSSKSKVRPRKPSLPQCERCGAEISCDPLKLDTNLLTGKADYHRESKRYIRLCNKCSCELSELVDRWLWDGRKGGNPELRKFPLKDGG